MKGLEPPSLAAVDPKSTVSTNFTTPASKICDAKVMLYFEPTNKKSVFFQNNFLKKVVGLILSYHLILTNHNRLVTIILCNCLNLTEILVNYRILLCSGKHWSPHIASSTCNRINLKLNQLTLLGCLVPNSEP